MKEKEPIQKRSDQLGTAFHSESEEQGGRISRAIAAGDDFVLLDAAPGQMTVLWLDPTWGARAVAEHRAGQHAAEALFPLPVVEEIPIFLLDEEEEDREGEALCRSCFSIGHVEMDMPEDLQETFGQVLQVHERRITKEDRDQTAEQPEPAEIEVVDVASMEAEQRRTQQNRDAQRRWRQNHPETHRENVRKWKQKPDVKARQAAAARERYRKKKQDAASTPPPIDETSLAE
jgi:hypothetical protein